MKKVVETDQAPDAIGPYSQGVSRGGFLFVSGQIPVDPVSGKLVDGGISAQTEMVLKNLRGVIEGGGSSLDRILKTTVYMVDLKEFKEMNRVYGEFFGKNPPARATVEVVALPLGSRVEIDAIAFISS
jgi:2-iminobutanoate/2-iminopropanoate deaminase